MEAKDILTITLSVLALCVSTFMAGRTWRYNRAALRSTERNSYMNALLNINREVVAHPSLWAVCDPKWPRATNHNSPDEQARRRGFIWYHINLFELVYSDFHLNRLFPLSRDDQLYWDSWHAYIRSFLKDSPEAQAIVSSDQSMNLLHRDVRDYLQGCLR